MDQTEIFIEENVASENFYLPNRIVLITNIFKV